ncbi:MAG: cadherin domain-containing protein [Chromatiales bacterium]
MSAAVPPNASPTIAIDDSTLGYTENDAVTQIDPAATLNDSDGDADWDGGTLEVQITANSEAADEISIPDNIVGTINTDGTNLLDGATTIGTLSASQGTVTNNSKLTVTFNANATNALVQQVLRAIHYRNTSNDPATSNRTVTFTGTDKNSASAGDTRTISVTATNDNPVITSNGGGDYAATSVNENTTAVTTVTASDPDSADTHTFSITGGADETLFNINNSTGALTFASAPNYDSPSDSDANNVYDVQVTVTDSGTDNLTDTQDIAVTVNNVNENPVITSDGGGDSASVNAAENQTAVTTVIAMDQDSADTLTYSLSDGADMAQFIINSSTGALTFAAAANYESPTDSDANGVYDVQVTVTDNGAGNLTDAQNIAVTVTNVNENPVITSNGGGDSAATSVNENTTAVSTVTASDPDSGDTHTFSITGGADETLFSINNSTGALTFASAPNYESPSDSGANNVYDVRVTVIDSGDLTDVQDIAVTVTNLNEAPSISGTPATTAGSGMLFSFVASASDPDAGTTLTYSINTTPAWATFNMTTGELSGTPTDGDVGKTTSNIVISVSDGSLSASLTAFSLTVIEGNQPPTIGGIPETSVLGHTAYSFIPTASDADSDPLTFSITNKPTWASFDSQTGKLSGTPSNSDQGTTTGIVISVSDGTASASLSFDLSVTENLDIDGDGMPNDWELANGLDPNDPNDADSDLDGDGLSNLDEYLASTNPNLDDNPPLVTPPADITVNAVGLFTPVNVGTANAYDTLDGVLTPTSDAADYYRPGSHAITWSATDAAGNTGTAMQTVNVIPLVSFSKDQTTSEGATVSFKVILNGPAVNYPVSVPYVVAGSAALDGSDHALSDGIASIASGLETKVSFTTVDDGPGEGTEQVVIAMDRPSNAVEGSQAVHTILLLEGNVPPRVELSADQGWGPTHTLVVGEGPVIVSSMVTDPNTGDVHSYDWSATDAALVDNDTAVDTYTFDPALLTPGLYTLRLSVDDASSSDSSTLSLNLISAAPILSDTQDSDGDTIDDASEGIGDSDNDGVANYLDALDSANVLQEQSAVSDSYLIETEPGVRLRLGTVALQHANGEASVDLEDIANFGGVAADSSYSYPSGLFDFAMEEVPAAGQSVQVVIPLLAPIPQNPVYRKVASGIWRNFVVDAANILASASGEPGYCPPPNDSDYTSGLTPGHWCVQLTIEDGGPNDADGRANHAIEDPGGVAQRLSTPFSVTSRGGGGGSAMLFLLALIVLALRRLRTTRKGVAK